MKQDGDVDGLVRARLRTLRLARGWSLDDLATRSHLSPSTLSRLETGHRRIGLDQLTALARTLGVSLDELVRPDGDDDVVIRPLHNPDRNQTVWRLSNEPHQTVAKVRVDGPAPRDTRTHPGRDWFLVLSGTVELILGDRLIVVETGQAASFSTMTPHAFGSRNGPAEILAVLDHEGSRTHVHD
ncbi:helix-turn-helix domain-containing protein [Symbioplanes lichenis]|uniref:helix-turn-helix domain-containing protein n=1 Tax=Symbioplanes lichenis TaxID=1629072 RepID=UPI00273890F4|nr:XRE family transcriptional regulator [Actinoplanes lichenis]